MTTRVYCTKCAPESWFGAAKHCGGERAEMQRPAATLQRHVRVCGHANQTSIKVQLRVGHAGFYASGVSSNSVIA